MHGWRWSRQQKLVMGLAKGKIYSFVFITHILQKNERRMPHNNNKEKLSTIFGRPESPNVKLPEQFGIINFFFAISAPLVQFALFWYSHFFSHSF
jgi:hypothetical protein